MTNKPTTNKKFAESNQLFNACCREAKLPPSTRQASKFRRKTGKAYGYRLEAKMAIEMDRRR